MKKLILITVLILTLSVPMFANSVFRGRNQRTLRTFGTIQEQSIQISDSEKETPRGRVLIVEESLSRKTAYKANNFSVKPKEYKPELPTVPPIIIHERKTSQNSLYTMPKSDFGQYEFNIYNSYSGTSGKRRALRN